MLTNFCYLCFLFAFLQIVRSELVLRAKSTLRESEWVGMRIQAYAASIVEPQAPPVLASGTVAQYCGGLGEWFIVFDSEVLRPQWKDLVRCAEEEDAFLESEDADGTVQESNYFTIISDAIPMSRALPSSSFVSDINEPENGVGSSELLVPWLKRRAVYIQQQENAASSKPELECCSLCMRGRSAAPYSSTENSSDTSDDELKKCCRCGMQCHRSCMPMSKIGLVESQDEWWCWGCASCQGCAQPSWERQQYMWNVKRADIPLFSVALTEATREADQVLAAITTQQGKKVGGVAGASTTLMLPYDTALAVVADATAVVAAAEPMVLAICAECMYRYKHAKEYCPLCYQLYADADATPTPTGPVAVIEDASAFAADNEKLVVAPSAVSDAPVPLSVSNTDAMEVVPHQDQAPIGGIDADSMVQCNDCSRWVHAACEGIDQLQYEAITLGTHPVWGDEYLCPVCRVQVPIRVIKQLKLIDKMELFALPVNETVAPTYFDVIRNPMDLSSITSKANKGMYKSLRSLRYDFELMCLNALIFNKVGDEYWLEAKTYYERGCKIFAQLPRKTTSTPLGLELREIIKKYKGVAVGNSSYQPSSSSSAGGKSGSFKSGVKKTAGDLTSSASNSSISSMGGKGRGRSAAAVSDAAGIDAILPAESDDMFCLPATAASSSRKSVGHGGARRSPNFLSNAKSNNSSVSISSDGSGAASTVTLPSCKSVPNDPKNYCCEVAPALIMTAEESVFNCCLDMCFVCASSASDASEMIYCIDCGESFHKYCVDLSASAGNALSWRCPNCKVCEYCSEHIFGSSVSKLRVTQADRLKRRKTTDPTATNASVVSLDMLCENSVDSRNVLYCDLCDDAYHLECIQPAVRFPPISALYQFSWFCANCVDCPDCHQSAAQTEVSTSKSWGLVRSSACFECVCVKASQLLQLELAEAGVVVPPEEEIDAAPLCCVCAEPCRVVSRNGNANNLNNHKQIDDITSTMQGRPYVQCSRCSSVCHISCHLVPSGPKASIFPIVEASTVAGKSAVSSIESYLCQDCCKVAASAQELNVPTLSLSSSHSKSKAGSKKNNDNGTSVVVGNVDELKEMQWNLHDLVSQIGRKRSFLESCENNRIADGMIQSELIAMYLRGSMSAPAGLVSAPGLDDLTLSSMYRTIIMWGYCRCYQLQYEIGLGLLTVNTDLLSAPHGHPSVSGLGVKDLLLQGDLMRNTVDSASTRQQWLRSRALRFVALWNRPCTSDRPAVELFSAENVEGCLLRQLNKQYVRVEELPVEKVYRLLGLDDEGYEYDPKTLMRIAILSAAVLHYTNFELKVPQSHKDIQINDILAVELACMARCMREAAAFKFSSGSSVETPPDSPAGSENELADGSAEVISDKRAEFEVSKALFKMFRHLLARPVDRIEAPVVEKYDLDAGSDSAAVETVAVCGSDMNVEEESMVPSSASVKTARCDDPSACFPRRSACLMQLSLKSVDDLLVDLIVKEFNRRFPVSIRGKLTRNQELMRAVVSVSAEGASSDVPVTILSHDVAAFPLSAAAQLVLGAGGRPHFASDAKATADDGGKVKGRKRRNNLSDAAVKGQAAVADVEVKLETVTSEIVPVIGSDEADTSSAPTPAAPAKKSMWVSVCVSDPTCRYFAYPNAMIVDTAAVGVQGNHMVSPLRGWGDVSRSVNESRRAGVVEDLDLCTWIDNRVCCLCGGSECDSTQSSSYKQLGRLIPYPKADTVAFVGLNHGYVHVNCIRFAADVFERDGVLFNTDNAKIRAALSSDSGMRVKPTICFMCDQKGATVACNRKYCGRQFHLPCAIACGCALFETRLSNGDDVDLPYDLHTCMVCPEHIGTRDDPRSKLYARSNPASLAFAHTFHMPENCALLPALPIEPRRRLVISDFSDSSHRSRLATTLSTVKGEKVVRSGACSILNVGTPRIDSVRFHDKYRIYPHYFQSVRIFWSMKTPMTRTVYKFQILTQGDLNVADYDRLLCRPSSKLYSTSQRRARAFANISKNSASSGRLSDMNMSEGSAEPTASTSVDADADVGVEEEARPVFQVVAMDDWKNSSDAVVPSVLTTEFVSAASATPYFHSLLSFSLEELYQDIITAVERCNKNHWKASASANVSAAVNSTEFVAPFPAKEKSATKASLRSGLRSLHANQVDELEMNVAAAADKSTYGRNAYQFFGLTLPFVRHSIENMIESVASMIVPANPSANVYPYSPCFKLPTPDAVLRIQQYQADLRSSLSTSNTGNIALLSLSGSARTDVRNIILHNANPTDESTHKTFKVLAKNISRPGPKKSTITDLSVLLKRSNKSSDEIDQDQQDDAIFGEDESEYLDWYNIQNNSSGSSAGFNLSAAQLRIIDRNRRRYAELSSGYEENSMRRLHVQKSHIHGFGLFAKTHFSKHEMIVEYIGEKIRQVVADKRESRYEQEGTGSCYLFRLDKEDIIDATKLGGMARFVNHSCCPNAYARVVATDELFKEKHIIIFAGRDILVSWFSV